METPETICRDSFRIRFFDTDLSGCASVPALCRYLQEAADTHTRRYQLSLTDLLAQGRMWVLSRLAMSFAGRPKLGDEITVETWGSNRLGGLRAYRDFRMLDASGRAIGEASSMWLILDPATRRPVRLPESILVFRHPEWKTPEAVDAVRLEPPQSAEFQETFRVGWRDLDANQHANNVRYIEWMIEALPETIHTSAAFSSLDIQFAGEARRGQSVVSISERLSDLCFRHSLKSSDGMTLAVARTTWRLP